MYIPSGRQDTLTPPHGKTNEPPTDMRRRTLYAFICSALLPLFAACSNDDDGNTVADTTSRTITINVPVSLTTSNTQVSSRTTGDPGVDDELDPPTDLYVFSWLQIDESNYQLYYTHMDNLTWVYSTGDDDEDENSHYKLSGGITLKFSDLAYDSEPSDDTSVGRTYVVATSKELTTDQLTAIVGDSYTSVLTSSTAVSCTSGIDTQLSEASVTFSLASSAADTSTDVWTSDDLRDLYSNPYADTDNGTTLYSSTSSDNLTHNDIRLYHCAAKIDFTWEVDDDIQSTTYVSSIGVNSLPTSCNIFKPAQNSSSAGTYSYTLSTDAGTQWIGRQYFYALQPSDGTISYKVTFGGSSSRNEVSTSFTPTSVNTTYTGWYRIIATVSDNNTESE